MRGGDRAPRLYRLPERGHGLGRLRALGLFPLWVPVVLLLGLAGCGKKEWPLAPEVLLPGPVRNLQVSQEGESLVLTWEAPRKNLLGQPLSHLEGYRLYRAATPGFEPPKGCPPEFVLLADLELTCPRTGQVEGERVRYVDRDLEPGKCYTYRVAAYGRGGALGAWSPPVSHAWEVLPRAPEHLRVEAGDREVWLAWHPVRQLRNGAPLPDREGYAVLRRSAATPWQRLTPEPLPTESFHDIAVDNEVEYIYTIRTIRRVGPYRLESLDAPPQRARPEDLTPPPPPGNLVAVPTRQGVELRWDPSPAPDLAGYRVYRRRQGESTPKLLTPRPVERPSFVDREVQPGRLYFYTVTAVDRSRRQNESAPAGPVSLSP